MIRQSAAIFAGGTFVVGMYMTLRSGGLPDLREGLLAQTLWIREAVIACVIAFPLIYAANLVLLFAARSHELRERTKIRWKEIIKSRLESRDPHFTYRDTLDRAAQLKMLLDRYRFGMRGRR